MDFEITVEPPVCGRSEVPPRLFGRHRLVDFDYKEEWIMAECVPWHNITVRCDAFGGLYLMVERGAPVPGKRSRVLATYEGSRSQKRMWRNEGHGWPESIDIIEVPSVLDLQ